MLAFRIALRYLLAPKAHAATGTITAIAMVGVCLTTAALLVVLSVFNGFRGVITDRLSLLDPAIAIVPAAGKTIADGDSVCRAALTVPGVEMALPVIAERALAVHGGLQQPVVLKGTPPDYRLLNSVDSLMVDGAWNDSDDGYCVTGTGPALTLAVYSGSDERIVLYAPQRVGNINLASPIGAFRSDTLGVAGVFELSQDGYDSQLIFVTLDVARRLFDYDRQATSVEVKVSDEARTRDIMASLSRTLGPGYIVRDRIMQQSEAYRMINVEKWMTSLLLVLIMLIATLNIIGAMSLLIAEKRDNMMTLRAMGATQSMVRRVFVAESVIISGTGAVLGIVLGLALSLCQQHFGWIKLSGDAATMIVSSYPVAVEAIDVLVVLVFTAVIASLTAGVTTLLCRR